MWITVLVPVAVLLLAVLLQRLEAAVLTVPDSAGRPNGPRSADPADPDPVGSVGLDPTRVDSLDAQRAPLALVPPREEEGTLRPSGAVRGSDRPSGRAGSTRSAHRPRARPISRATG